MEKSIALFDFDGTIVKKDSFVDFAVYSLGWEKFVIVLLRFSPMLFLYSLGLISGDTAKEKLFSGLFKGLNKEKFKQLCDRYSLSRIPEITRKEALSKISWHKEKSHLLVIASSSMKNWIEPWAKRNGFDNVIATLVEFKEGKLTGKFESKNCNREEKIKRFLTEYPNRKDYELYVYGNSKDDNWLFGVADKKFYKKFN